MAFRFTERRNSPSIGTDPPTYVSRWTATGTNYAANVHAYALANTPALVGHASGAILYRQDVKVEAEGHELFRVEVPYAERKQENGSYTLSFDTTGGTLHIRASKQTIAAYGSGAARTDHKQAIGVSGEPGKDPEGADIVVPALKLTVNFKHPLGVITIAQIKNLARWTGRTNSDTFLTFAPGEVLFLGATGSEGPDQPCDVQYHFACSENLTGLSYGAVSGIAKKGHELFWIQWKTDVANNAGTRVPKAVYVERIYDTIALAAALGFGG